MNTDTKQRLQNIFARFASPETLALARRETMSPARRPAAMPPAHYRQEPQIIHMPTQQRPLLSKLITAGAAVHPEASPGALFEIVTCGTYAYSRRKTYRTGPLAAAYVAAFGVDSLAGEPPESQMIWRLSRLVGYDVTAVNQAINELTREKWDRAGVAEFLEDKGL
ncbi:MAG: hypothetical protein KC421_19375 [Anaerolineales bacterium]|nr:hypothetical protein [Anaerolineales bacterium]